MNEFELRRRLQDWRQPQRPARDLWPAIAARIGAASVPVPRVRPRPWPELAAAGVVLALAAGLLAAGAGPAPTPTVDAVRLITESYAAAQREVAAWAPAGDGSWSRATAELDAAQAGLEAALASQPDSQALRSLLIRTHAQRLRLQWLAARAG